MIGVGFIRCNDGGNDWRNTPSVGNRRLLVGSPQSGFDKQSRRILFDGEQRQEIKMKRAGAFYQLVYHFAWSTKNRLTLITPEVEERLYPYIGYKCKELGYRLHAVNGMEDHTHVLVSLTPGHLVADVAKNLKGASSHYINKESGLDTTLYWQDGYGVVTIRESEIPKVVRYIRDQKQHHRDGTLFELLERMQEQPAKQV